MGKIADLLAVTKAIGFSGNDVSRSPTDRGSGQRLWRQIFGNVTNKEEGIRRPVRPFPGGTHSRSFASADASITRLVEALRSMAPGGWSDDRWSQTRNFLGPVYIGIDRKAKQLQQAEFQVFRKDKKHPDGKVPVEEGDDAYELVQLLEKPNPQDSFGDMMYRWLQQLDLTGSALTWMVPNYLHRPMELYPIPTAIAIPQPAVNPDYPDGYYRIQPVYPYGPFSQYPTPTSAVGAAIPAQWMLRFMYPHPFLRYDGYSPQTGMNLYIDENNMAETSRHYKMRRGSNPDVVLNFKDGENIEPLPEPEVERMRAEWEMTHGGPTNHGKFIVGTPGGELTRFDGHSPKEMDYNQSVDQLLSIILGGGFGITKSAAGMTEDAAYATLFATLKQLHLVTLQPTCDSIAASLTRHLAIFWGENLTVEIRLPRIDDHDIKGAKLDRLIAGKAITKNELRKELDMALTEEPWGDEIAGEMSAQQPLDANGQPMPMPQGMPGQPQGAMPPGDGENAPNSPVNANVIGDLIFDQGDADEKKVKKSRPEPGNLGRGALGAMKSLRNGKTKSLKPKKSTYERVREVLLNGSH